MTKVETIGDYDFYIGLITTGKEAQTLYNIVPKSSKEPVGGYPNRLYIERIKGIKFPNRYQPTLHGMTETYSNGEWDGIS